MSRCCLKKQNKKLENDIYINIACFWSVLTEGCTAIIRIHLPAVENWDKTKEEQVKCLQNTLYCLPTLKVLIYMHTFKMAYESWSLKPDNLLNILTGSSSFDRGSALFALLLILQGLVHNLDHRDTEGLRRTRGNCHDSVSVKINVYSVAIKRKRKRRHFSQVCVAVKYLLLFCHCQFPQPKKTEKSDVSLAAECKYLWAKCLQRAKLTMSTSPPPRMRGMDSAWMSVGNLKTDDTFSQFDIKY